MRRTLFAVLATTALTSSAFAADLPRSYHKAAPMAAPAFNWTGLYVGLNAGYGWGRVSDVAGSIDMNGFIGGGQIGYNWQGFGSPLVLGIEADFQGSAQKDSVSGLLIGVPVTVESKLPWFATVRARAGVAVWDRGLIYATGGLSISNVKVSIISPVGSASSDDTKLGWTIGGGYEQAFAPNWSGKIEYLYLDSGNSSTTLFGTTFDARIRSHIVRAGVNYRF